MRGEWRQEGDEDEDEETEQPSASQWCPSETDCGLSEKTASEHQFAAL
jgi:hypothetical protein